VTNHGHRLAEAEEHGGPEVVGEAVATEGPESAAGHGGVVDDQDLEPARREQARRAEAADAGPDDDDVEVAALHAALYDGAGSRIKFEAVSRPMLCWHGWMALPTAASARYDGTGDRPARVHRRAPRAGAVLHVADSPVPAGSSPRFPAAPRGLRRSAPAPPGLGASALS
jgi:hypothetical protein